MTTVIFVRHGQSTANLERVFAGHTDAPLTDLGHKQAENTAKFLKNYPICAIYSSDLARSMQTAEPTGKLHHLPVIPDKELREIYAGEWEGRSYDELMEKYGWRNLNVREVLREGISRRRFAYTFMIDGLFLTNQALLL